MQARHAIFMIAVMLGASAPAVAQEPASERERRDVAFVELAGAYGLQIGTTLYVPDGAADQFKHPLTNGPALGVTAGLALIEGLHLIANYEHTWAGSRDGSVAGALDDIEGSIRYHTVTVGLRLGRRLGPGTLYAELAGGLVLPFETELELTYAPELGQLPAPIAGTGSKRDRYNLGPGGHGLLGYAFDLGGGFYAGSAIKLKAFETNNNGESTLLDNFVVDFETLPPTAVTTEIAYDSDGGEHPSTYSVQDARLQLVVGARF